MIRMNLEPELESELHKLEKPWLGSLDCFLAGVTWLEWDRAQQQMLLCSVTKATSLNVIGSYSQTLITDLISPGCFRDTVIGLMVQLPCGQKCQLSLLCLLIKPAHPVYPVNLCSGYRWVLIATVSIQPLNVVKFLGMYYRDSPNFIMIYLFPRW